MKQVAVIGAGFSGLSAAAYLAQAGYGVTVYEKGGECGGRARQLVRDGFRFDMGPTFYWMPDIFETFFADFGTTPQEYYTLRRLDPGYRAYFGPGDSVPIPAQIDKTLALFEQIEPGSGRFLEKFLRKAAYNYRVAMDKVVWKPGRSPLELLMPATAARTGQFLQSLSRSVERGIRNPKLRQILEFPVLFLGAKPSDIPAFYCFMNYADMVLGTWHVEGGMANVATGMERLAREQGVQIRPDSEVEQIVVRGGKTTGVIVNGEHHAADAVVAAADYHHAEELLEEPYRNYKESYWSKRTMAPSALLYYIAFDRQLDRVSHHTLFFDTDFGEHASAIYDTPAWPADPMFYASFPSQTDASMAPEGKEAAVILIPTAAGLADTPAIRQRYFDRVIERMERLTGQSLREDVLWYESYAASDFVRDYHAYRGNAYGLANTLRQTAFLKPKIENKKVRNLFYTGQLTVPGPGVPPAIISGKIAARLAAEHLAGE